MIAAPSSGSGKTLVTLGLLRALTRQGVAARGIKTGPDYIDPAFHRAATGKPCFNLDPWAMPPDRLRALADQAGAGADITIAEGVMGLFDGAADGRGSTADLAAALGWPVILVLDVMGQSTSAAAIVEGFRRFRPGLSIAGVILNRTGSDRHASMIADAVATLHAPPAILGAIPRDEFISVPSRHLGLVQAEEHQDLDALLERAADLVEKHVNLDLLRSLGEQAAASGASPRAAPQTANGPGLPVLGQHIAIARDRAFAFCYDTVPLAWQAQGASVSFFSPLADEAPSSDADAVYLPGGYPELHAGRLAGNSFFLNGLRDCAATGKPVFGECGGYMVLGEALIDADGASHPMAGLLPLTTSFAARKRHLGYRRAQTLSPTILGPAGSGFAAHEFHYATVIAEGPGDPLFAVTDARRENPANTGLVRGSVAGSFLHLIDRACT
ncbi:cobyrinate a,c-diamide synthase [Hwanghaeella grinnelliae]|uniref:Cobyrinate a,c-diamide synthase n=1 Tax=Hwanghaeella grinnelliae TaxID=2500179 RepID=A0A437QQW4_9PROT|nr:cobyrinate a,c-diamide synthase [Hwanghaeella grinnelliae]